MERKTHDLPHFTVELWLEMWRGLIAATNVTTGTIIRPSFAYYQLCAIYNDVRRHYHDLGHINAGVGEWAAIKPLLAEPYVWLLAWTYHDYRCNPGGLDNVDGSANDAAELWGKIGLPKVLAEFERLVRTISYSDHSTLTDDPDIRLFCDVDLLPLAIDRSEFMQNTLRLCWEYRTVGIYEPEAMARMTAFLEKLVARGRIYQSEHYASHEQAARDNIAHLVDLVKYGYPLVVKK